MKRFRRIRALLVALAALGVGSAVAAPAHAAGSIAVWVEFDQVQWGRIDDSGPFWDAKYSHVAQMFGRYYAGSSLGEATDKWRGIGSWDAVGTADIPKGQIFDQYSCAGKLKENSNFCMWNVGAAYYWPNGNAPTRWQPAQASLPASQGWYKFRDFPTCSSKVKIASTSPHCVDGSNNIMSHKTGNNKFLLGAVEGGSLTFRFDAFDYDETSSSDQICSVKKSIQLSQYQLDHLPVSVVLTDAGAAPAGACQVIVKITNANL